MSLAHTIWTNLQSWAIFLAAQGIWDSAWRYPWLSTAIGAPVLWLTQRWQRLSPERRQVARIASITCALVFSVSLLLALAFGSPNSTQTEASKPLSTQINSGGGAVQTGGGPGSGGPGGNGAPGGPGNYTANQYNNYGPTPVPTPAPNIPSVVSPIRFGCFPITSPFLVAPNADLYILIAHPDIDLGFTEYFGKPKSWLWPTKKQIKQFKDRPVDRASTLKCDLTNYGEHNLVDVATGFSLQFSVADPTDPEGKWQDIRKPTKYLLNGFHRVVIPAIAPEKTFTFYLVNETHYFVIVGNPSFVVALVSGESTKRALSLLPEDETIAGLLQSTLGASTFDWLNHSGDRP